MSPPWVFLFNDLFSAFTVLSLLCAYPRAWDTAGLYVCSLSEEMNEKMMSQVLAVSGEQQDRVPDVALYDKPYPNGGLH